jgi:hypothetical protein
MGLAYNILTLQSHNKVSYAVKRGNAAAERVLKFDQQNPITSKMDG